jgi:alkanesulfonate monooxygenase SsuD/methylene tetrahydromethanopterin reductase-like flavin-dependent oxidoreductase (luciferase family)
MGTHLSTAFFLPQQELVRNGIRSFRAELAAQGIDPAERDVLGVMPMYCGETRQESIDAFVYTMNYFEFFAGLDARSPHRSKDYAAYDRASAQYGEASFDSFDKANLVMVGEPKALIEKIEWIIDYFENPTYLLFEVAQGGMPPKMVIPTLERFAREVMPHFPEKSTAT